MEIEDPKVSEKDLLYQKQVSQSSPEESLSQVLSTLEVSDNILSQVELTTESLLELSAAKDICSVLSLDLSESLISSFVQTPLLDPQLFRNLEFLDLSGNGLKDYSAVSQCSSLQVLVISRNFIDTLRPLAFVRSLRSLKASKNKIKDLHGLERLPFLHTLEVPENSITSFQNSYFVLKTLQNLKDLHIDMNACFLKTYRAFDIFAHMLILEKLNGTSLQEYRPRVNSMVIAKISLLNNKYETRNLIYSNSLSTANISKVSSYSIGSLNNNF